MFSTYSVSCSNLFSICLGIQKRQINTFLKFLSKSNFSEGTVIHSVGTGKIEPVVWTSAAWMRGHGPSLPAVALRRRSCVGLVGLAICLLPLCRGYSCHVSLGLLVCPAHIAPVLIIKTLLLALSTLCHGSSDKYRRKHWRRL